MYVGNGPFLLFLPVMQARHHIAAASPGQQDKLKENGLQKVSITIKMLFASLAHRTTTVREFVRHPRAGLPQPTSSRWRVERAPLVKHAICLCGPGKGSLTCFSSHDWAHYELSRAWLRSAEPRSRRQRRPHESLQDQAQRASSRLLFFHAVFLRVEPGIHRRLKREPSQWMPSPRC